MEKVFFSERNINNQTLKLVEALGAADNVEAKKRCKMLMIKNMKDGYIKYKDVQNKMSNQEFLNKLNKKCIENCVSFFQKRKREREMGNIDNISRTREREVNGDRDLRIPDRGEFTTQKRDRDATGNTPKYLNSGAGIGGSNYASFDPNLDGGYVSACGEVKRGQLMVQNDESGGGGNRDMRIGSMSMGKGRQDELLRRMNELQGSYQGNNMNQRPPDINFALDGGDTRGRNTGTNAVQTMDFGQFQGLDSYDSGNMGSNFGDNNATSIDELMGFGSNNGSSNNGGGLNNGMNMKNMDNNQMQQMMQMMMKMMQQNQNGGAQQQNSFNDNIDVKTRLSNLMNERTRVDSMASQQSKGGKFDPTKSPHEMNNFFFEQGRKIIRDLNADALSDMDSKQMDFLIDIYKSVIIKDKQMKQEKKLKNSIEAKSKEIDITKEEETNVDITDTPSTIKNLKLDSSEYDNESNINIEFDTIKNVTSLSITGSKFPKYNKNINDNMNTFSIKTNLDDEEFDTFVLENGTYTVINVIKKLQEIFDAKEKDIKIFQNARNHIEIRSKEVFELKFYEDSILKLLGFTKELYEGANTYTSEQRPNMNMFKTVDVYVSINSKLDNEPFMVVDLSDHANNRYPVTKKFKKQNIESIGVILTPHNSRDIIYKFTEPYKLKFELGCK